MAGGSSEKINHWEVDEQRRFVDQLSEQERCDLFRDLEIEDSVDLLDALAPAQAVEIVKSLPCELNADLIEELPANLANLVLRELPQDDTQEIIEEIENGAKAEILESRLNYAEHTAGAMMRWYALSYEDHITVGEFLADLKKRQSEYNDEDLQYFYTIDKSGRLTGVINSRSVLLAEMDAPLERLKIPNPFSVLDTAPLEELDDIVADKHYLSFPVVSKSGKFLGVVGRDVILDAIADDQAEQFLRSRGIVGGEELRSMSLLSRCVKRLSWLTPNIGLNMFGAVVIAMFQSTLEQVILLAVFLPVISNMSGCSGSQAIAVSIRELTLGLVTPRDVMRVIKKEFLIGLPSGILLGILLGVIAGVWGKNAMLGCVIGAALFLNTIISVVLGGMLPLVLKKLKIDPALASAPVLTMCTDLCGFFLALSFTTLSLDYILT